MQVKMMQHAVGQGGMFSGELDTGRRPLRWVYDCGSNQRDALLREINTIADGGKIDLLFLSHLDSDHISGVDQFLAQINVGEVVLPYLNERTLLATMARDASLGSLNGLFVEAANDLAGWFGSRGVETVTFVSGGDDDEGGTSPMLPFEPGGGEGDCWAKWTQEPHRTSDMTGDAHLLQPVGGSVAMMQRAASDAALQVFTPGGALNWALIPYVHLPSEKQMWAFDQALSDAFGSPLNKKNILARAKEAEVRDKLRECYDALWLDHNLITMTLYSGPLKHEFAQVSLSPFRHCGGCSDELGGWILTGDAHLGSRRRRQRFLQFYKGVTALTKVLMLPHHGSVHNHSDLVLDAMPHLIIGYAAAGPNSYGHPHLDVKNAVNAHWRAHFRRVSEKRFSKIVMQQRRHSAAHGITAY